MKMTDYYVKYADLKIDKPKEEMLMNFGQEIFNYINDPKKELITRIAELEHLVTQKYGWALDVALSLYDYKAI